MPTGDRLLSFIDYLESAVQPSTGDEDQSRTIMVGAFEGWNDAGSAATDTVNKLIDLLDAEFIGRLGEQTYYDYQFHRPIITRRDGGRPIVFWPQVDFYLADLKTKDDRQWQLILFKGPEPNFKWQEYCAEILTVGADHNAEGLILLGAYLDAVPHTRPNSARFTSDDEQLRADVGAHKAVYEGPTGITGILAFTAAQSGLPTLSLWARVPSYVAHSPLPKSQLALIRKLEDLLELHLDLHDLEDESNAWLRAVAALMEEDTELAAHVAELEHDVDSENVADASGEIIAQEFERFLRRREDGEDKR